jgi:hypothetical protein
MDLSSRIGQLDTSLFDSVESQTSVPDKQGLLALHAAVAGEKPFRYLEIGSHLGGSLQVVIADPRCEQITSIDPRPQDQPDERAELGFRYEYDGNSTDRMLGLLREVPGADLDKLQTIEAGTDTLDPADLATRPDWCFIDGEHTETAALRDARFCAAAIGNSGVIAFHDSAVTPLAIETFVRGLRGRAVGFSLPDSLYVVEVGERRLLTSPTIRSAFSRGRFVAECIRFYWRMVNLPVWRGALIVPGWALERRMRRSNRLARLLRFGRDS